MPRDDLLRFIGPPPAPSGWWLVLAATLVAAVIAWCIAVLVWTSAPHRLRRIPVLRNLHVWVLRRRFTRTVRQITQAYRDGALSAAQAGGAYSRVVRTFLHLRTGVRAQYLHLTDLADSEVGSAVQLLTVLYDTQFNRESRADVMALGRSAEELIHRWS